MTRAFAGYGRVTDCIVMRNCTTGESRGFGFLKFSTEETVEKIIAKQEEHRVGGKRVECRKSTRGSRQARINPNRPVAVAEDREERNITNK